jgi:uroporphyrinogen decarboxylase
MTPRERFIAALERKPPAGRVPHFELVFFLTMEAFGKVHPEHRNYRQWDQMEEKERQLHREDVADIYIRTAERFEQSAIYLTAMPSNEEHVRVAEIIRERTDARYCLLAPGDATYCIPHGDTMMEMSCRMVDDPGGMKDAAQEGVDRMLEKTRIYSDSGVIDGYCMCADYSFNVGPFMSPDQFGEFVAPYLKQLCDAYRERKQYTIKHTDGNIMPIIDQIADAGPDALHSIDPQGGMDIAEVKRLYGDRLCLVGNVSCGALDTGTDEECAASTRYALEHGMPGGGYIFSTSNCIYTGMRLDRYELILDIWRKEGNYPEAP